MKFSLEGHDPLANTCATYPNDGAYYMACFDKFVTQLTASPVAFGLEKRSTHSIVLLRLQSAQEVVLSLTLEEGSTS